MKDKRQVVFVMTDTTRWDMLGCYGNKDMKTPNLDQLANEGVKFNKNYTTQPVCGPARSAIFTGLYPHSNGGITNTVSLTEGVKTIGQYLKPNQINSAYIGKWHLDGGDYFGNGICPDGYDKDYWYDMRCYINELSDSEKVLSRQESASLENGGIKEEFTFAHRVSDRAIDYIDKNYDKDMFLCVSYDEPHQPYLCPEPYASMYENYDFPKTPNYYDNLENKPLYQKLWAGETLYEDKDNLKLRPQLFLGCNSFADYEIGRVLDKVKEKMPNALIIFTSDHGEALGAHSLNLKGPALYEEITHVPLIIKGSSFLQAPSNEEYNHVTSHIDLVPTLLDYYNINIPPVLAGKSMRSIIENPKDNILREEVFCEFHRYEIDHDGFGGIQFMRGVISDDRKFAVHLLDNTDELYDTKKDPYELDNLIENEVYLEDRNYLHQKVLDWMNDTRDPYRGYQWKCRYWNKNKPNWDCDGYTRQRPSDADEIKQLDYDTALEITENIRYKIKKSIK
ncbi:MAG: DUF4976 domain-containing protein [Spirochaetia bacterium]|nr:DUF4976 domain-containing protein [Spirochaetia bacterium]